MKIRKFYNTPSSNYASVPMNNNLKLRLVLCCCIFSHSIALAQHSTSLKFRLSFAELKHNSKNMVYSVCLVLNKLSTMDFEGGQWGIAKTAKPQQNASKTAKLCPKLLKTETTISV